MRNIRIFKWGLGLLLLLVTSCSNYPSDVKKALKIAGDNKSELEEVINHYQKPEDSLKLKAAYFLIGNMRNKFYREYNTPQAELMKELRKPTNKGEIKWQEVINLRNDSIVKSKWEYLKRRYGNHSGIPHLDLETITAEILIDNIDHAFKVWEGVSWSEKYSFDEFCEYVLPYRNHNDTPEIWRGEVHEKFKWLKDSIKGDEFLKASNLLNDSIFWFRWHLSFYEFNNIPISDVFKGKYGSCKQHSSLKIAALRSQGIPCSQIFVKGRTTWIGVPNKQKRFLDWEFKTPPSNEAPFITDKRSERYSKIYELSYRIQTPELLEEDKENVPKFFQNTSLKDVTSNHTHTMDVEISIDSKNRKGDRFVYLCEYSNFSKGWEAVDWGKIQKGKATFKQMGLQKIYNPMYFGNGEYTAAGAPFYLTRDRRMVEVNLSEEDTHTVRLFRKNEMNFDENAFSAIVVGNHFEGSNTSDFSKVDTLFTITERPNKMETFKVNNANKYRYIRYKSGYQKERINEFYMGTHLAELNFLGEDGNQLKGKLMVSDSILGDPSVNNLFDEDIRTNFNYDFGCWMGFDLGEPASVSHIRYLFRNSFNTVEPNDSYELFYWDNDKWVSKGIKKATDTFIEFEVPKNSVLWLRDRTKGNDEQIFYVDENGNQIWG